jgi:hypothetical protein
VDSLPLLNATLLTLLLEPQEITLVMRLRHNTYVDFKQANLGGGADTEGCIK